MGLLVIAYEIVPPLLHPLAAHRLDFLLGVVMLGPSCLEIGLPVHRVGLLALAVVGAWATFRRANALPPHVAAARRLNAAGLRFVAFGSVEALTVIAMGLFWMVYR